jgi:pyruvate formate-lyase activating enzyme-like uncharacterized protein
LKKGNEKSLKESLYIKKEYSGSGMENLIRDKTGSLYNYLSRGCKLCQEGAKMVLFVTGLCPKNCFYCPLSDERRGKDIVFANERVVRNDEDLLEEAELMNALGTGITGGEPLLEVEKVIHYIRLLKTHFGREHHIHLYTSLAPERHVLEKLADAGLDEIRFHPAQANWGKLKDSEYEIALITAKELGLEAGIEVPSLEGAEKVAAFVNETDTFLNLNELEFSDNNSEALLKKGFFLESDTSNAAAESCKYAEKACSVGKKVHFCSSTYKDSVQLRKRFQRIAKNTAREFDEVTEDGTLIYGVIDSENQELIAELFQNIEFPEDLYEIRAGKIEIAWWVIEELKEEMKKEFEPLGTKFFIIERFPFKDGLVVEVIPL